MPTVSTLMVVSPALVLMGFLGMVPITIALVSVQNNFSPLISICFSVTFHLVIIIYRY